MSHVFKVGDKVSFGGLEGKIIKDNFGIRYPLLVELNNSKTYEFTANGKLDTDHTEPLLKLISPAKTKVKRALYAYQMPYKQQPYRGYLYVKDDEEFKSIQLYKEAIWFKRLPETEIEVEE